MWNVVQWCHYGTYGAYGVINHEYQYEYIIYTVHIPI